MKWADLLLDAAGSILGEYKKTSVDLAKIQAAKYYLEDGCAATENLILGLHAYGVGTCWVAGDKKEYADAIRKLLNVPEKYTLVSLVPAGYPAEVKIADKKDTKKVVFTDTFKIE